jgi:hypothetical protein
MIAEKVCHSCVAGTRSLGCVHKVRALTPGTLRLVLNNFSQSSIVRCDAEKSAGAALTPSAWFGLKR